jgi:hypothetical protein
LIKRRLRSKLINDLVAMQEEYKCIVWGFENNNAYEDMRQTLIEDALRRQVSLPLIGVTNSVPLEVRIDSLEPFISCAFPKILFHKSQTQLLDELDGFPEPQNGHHYDGLSALHILWEIAVSRAGGIPNIQTASPVKSFFKNLLKGY